MKIAANWHNKLIFVVRELAVDAEYSHQTGGSSKVEDHLAFAAEA